MESTVEKERAKLTASRQSAENQSTHRLTYPRGLGRRRLLAGPGGPKIDAYQGALPATR